MSTHSTIGIDNSDGTVSYVYCHFDGRVRYVGRILNSHYVEETKIRELLSLGNLIDLGENITPTCEDHKYLKSEPGVCVFFLRDDDSDEDNECKTVAMDEWLKDCPWKTPYQYFFSNGQWRVRQRYADNPTWDSVTNAIKEEEESK